MNSVWSGRRLEHLDKAQSCITVKEWALLHIPNTGVSWKGTHISLLCDMISLEREVKVYLSFNNMIRVFNL